MEIYSIKEEYVNYLKQFDDRVCDPKSDSQFGRKYAGVVLEIGEFLYFAPLTSSVVKKNKKTGISIFKRNFTDVYLFDNDKHPIGVVKLNNMIPIPIGLENNIVKPISINDFIYSFDEKDRKYGWLLTKDQRILYKHKIQTQIYKKASDFYKNRHKFPNLLELCCDFKLLEQKAIDYVYEININKPKSIER